MKVQAIPHPAHSIFPQTLLIFEVHPTASGWVKPPPGNPVSFALLYMQTTVPFEACGSSHATTRPTAFVGMAPMSIYVLDGLSLITLAPHSFSLLLPLEERPETSSRTRPAYFYQGLNLLSLLPGSACLSVISHFSGLGFLIILFRMEP